MKLWPWKKQPDVTHLMVRVMVLEAVTHALLKAIPPNQKQESREFIRRLIVQMATLPIPHFVPTEDHQKFRNDISHGMQMFLAYIDKGSPPQSN
jgi:hypothetical protein